MAKVTQTVVMLAASRHSSHTMLRCAWNCAKLTQVSSRSYYTKKIPHKSYFDSVIQEHRNMGDVKEGILMGIGNPLLDITVQTDDAFLKKYDLKANDAIIAGEKQMPMFKDLVENFTPEYVAGGATQNSIRIAQWILETKNATSFFGCVGEDNEADVQRSKGQADGVNVKYQVDKGHPTGRCGAVITGHDRSLVAMLGAADYLSVDHFKLPDNWKLVEAAKAFYIGGFVFTTASAVIQEIAKHSAENGKTLVMNLSAPFLIPYFVDPKVDIISKTDLLFGNYDEAEEFCKQMGIATGDIKAMAVKVSELPKKNEARKRIVVFTGGSDPTIVACDGKVFEHPIIPVQKDDIKDTNGCGDSFVGGFLSQLVQGRPIEDCLRCGNYCANIVIKHWGCTYPPKPDFK